MKLEMDQLNYSMRRYPAKLLLFGEYGLMFGAKALTIPFSRFSGYFSKNTNVLSNKEKESALELKKFVSWYLDKNIADKMVFPLDVKAFSDSLNDGLFFESSIPLQYGVGSSGALCAAIYNEFGSFISDKSKLSPDDLKKLRDDFSTLESYFHGRSSGLDPLVSFLNRPILLENDVLKLVDIKIDELPWQVVLMDTLITSPTSPLVKLFIDKMEQPEFNRIFNKQYVDLNNKSIEAILANDSESFFNNVRLLSQFQFKYLGEMIPEKTMADFENIVENELVFKLLGSGGGGFMLGFHPDKSAMVKTKNSFQIN